MTKHLLKITAIATVLLTITVGCNKEKNVTGVSLNESSITLTVDGTATLTATVLPGDASNKTVSWASNDTTIATVANGIVIAKKVGAAIITVTTEEGNYTAECTVTVTHKLSEGTVGYYGQLQVNASTGKIEGSKSEANKPVQVKGVSFGWNMYSESSPYFTAAMVDRMVDQWKAEIVRAPMGAKSDTYNQGYDNAGARTKLIERIEKIVNQAIERGVYVIIDWHSHTADEAAEKQLAIQYFGEMAQKYGSKDNVIFEIFNEPTAQNWNTIRAYAVDVIAEIRKYSDNLILVGTQGYSQMIGAPADNRIDDPNVAYVLHFYANSHKMSEYTAFGGSQFSVQINKALKEKLPIFVSEWGTADSDGNGIHNPDNSDTWMKWCDDNQISWCAWQVSHKNEASAFFRSKGNVSGYAASWFETKSNFSASGQYIFDLLTSWANKAE